ncbi:8766_t:CDS:2 [Cetraspora pellucida]|uniref:8766_t:CDS:1 n=1 Tax=Cetraspora pellucida TaxID=1433469 RepID=A0A9N9NIB1_9GLOM|nr:8766_t:CDS:2 [Cetraspora pellucida]
MSKFNDDELLNLFFSELATIKYQKDDNVFTRIKKKIQETFDLEELKEDSNLDKEIQNFNLNKKQKNKLQMLRINQEGMIIRYNEIKTGIEEETKINRLRDFQFWYMQITGSQNLTDRLKKKLQKIRKDRFDFLVDYIAEFNRIQQGIQDETEIERLRDFWFSEITKSKLENDDKQKLNELREEHIRKLEQTQPGTNDFNYIRNKIYDKKKIPNLKVNRHWFREIRNSKNLSKEQKVALNIQRDKKLKALSNKKYDKINEEIPKIETANLLNNRCYINIMIYELKNENLKDDRDVDTLQQKRQERYQLIQKKVEISKYDRYKRQITNFYNRKQVVLLSNDNVLAKILKTSIKH